MINPKHPLYCRGMGSRSQQAQMTTENTCLFLGVFFTKPCQIFTEFSKGITPNNHNILREWGQRSANSDDLEDHLSDAWLLTFANRSSQILSLMKPRGPLYFSGISLKVKVTSGSHDLVKHLSASWLNFLTKLCQIFTDSSQRRYQITITYLRVWSQRSRSAQTQMTLKSACLQFDSQQF